MQIKSIAAGAAIAWIAGVGSVSADELSVADTTGDTGTPFAMLNGIATEQLSVQEMEATRGAMALLLPQVQYCRSSYCGVSTAGQTTNVDPTVTYEILVTNSGPS